MGADSDSELFERWRSGDAEAGGALFDRYFETIFAFLRNKVPKKDVADVVQKVFLAAVESRDRFRGEASVRTFLFAIARRQLMAFYYEQRRDRRLDFSEVTLEDLHPSPASLADEKGERRVLLEALRKIPVELQVAVELYYWEGLRAKDLAVVLDIPEGTVRSRLRRALEALRVAVGAVGVSGRQLESTMDDLEHWAERLRDID